MTLQYTLAPSLYAKQLVMAGITRRQLLRDWKAGQTKALLHFSADYILVTLDHMFKEQERLADDLFLSEQD